MKTDELIELLGASGVEPVRGRPLRAALVIALAIGTAAAFCVMLTTLGTPPAARSAEHWDATVLVAVFAIALVFAGSSFLLTAMRPGTIARRTLVVIGLLMFLIPCAAITALLEQGSTAAGVTLWGPQSLICLTCIPLFAIAPFAALVWVLRSAAPTSPRLTGAVAGVVSGALGAVACALHAPDGSLPLILFWYGAPIILCALAGAALGPRLLRW